MSEMKKINIIHKMRGNLIVMAIVALSLGSCIQGSFDYESSTTSETGKFKGTALDFVNTAKAVDSLSLIKEAITITGLQNLFSQTGPRTFIIPRNVGIRAYLKTNGYASLAAMPLATLTEVVKYHIVKATYYTQDVQFMANDKPIQYQTEGINPLFLSHNSGFQVLVNQGTKKSFTIWVSNIRPTNGIIHISSDVVYYLP